ncbi:hypothetical protein [Haloprofundus halobius]|nr:hypothetical protein [Haloprofundus halobius]
MRISESDPNRGHVDVETIGVNQRGAVVISWTAHALVARRPR